MYRTIRKITSVFLFFGAVWIAMRCFLPVFTPFLFGLGLAVAAEPGVRFLTAKLHFPRRAAAAVSVSMVFLLTSLLFILVLAFVVRELGMLAGILPDWEKGAVEGLSLVSRRLLSLTAKMPPAVRQLMDQSISQFFSGSSRLLEDALRSALSLAGGVLVHIPDGALILGTSVLSGYMLSVKLPAMARWLSSQNVAERIAPLIIRLKAVRIALFGYVRAQVALMGTTFLVLCLSFLVLRIRFFLLWALLISFIDAFPVLGTGIVLIPWSLALALQGDGARSLGLLCTYLAASLLRSALEPRFVGRQLGLDPLAVLMALYAGYRLWGIAGMVAAPLLAVTANQLLEGKSKETAADT